MQDEEGYPGGEGRRRRGVHGSTFIIEASSTGECGVSSDGDTMGRGFDGGGHGRKREDDKLWQRRVTWLEGREGYGDVRAKGERATIGRKG